MKFFEFGPTERPLILCMHGMMQSWESMYAMVKPLEQQYRLLFPAMDGFYEGCTDFTSFADQARQIEEYVNRNHSGKIDGVYAISQGALLVTEILTRNNIRIQTAVLDGTYVAHQGKFSGWATYHMLNYCKEHRDHPPKIMLVSLKLMGWNKQQAERAMSELRDQLYWKASKESIRKNCMENYTYHVRSRLSDSKTDIYLWCGEKERYAIKSHKILKKYIIPREEDILSGLGHGELASLYPEKFHKKLIVVFEQLK